MATSSELTELVVEQLAGFGHVKARSMFGGIGFFRHNLMFALIAYDELYFKTDDQNREQFEAENLTPFCYESKDGKRTVMSYHRAPDRVLEDAKQMRIWAEAGFAAALRADNAKPSGKRKYQG